MKPPAKRVYAKNGAWYYVDIRRKWHRLGKLDAPEHEILAELARIKSSAGDDNALTKLFDRYEREVLPKKALKTSKDQKRQLERLRQAFRQFSSPKQIRPAHVAQYLDAHPSPTMANREIALLSHVLTKALRWGLVEVNACAGIERNTEKPRRHYVDDWSFWMAWVMASEELRLVLELLYITGQRPADVLGLRQADVHPDGLFFRQAKTGKEIIIDWSPRLRDLVQWARSRQAITGMWVIADAKGQRYTYSAIAQQFGKLMARYPGERFQLRDIRRKSGTDHATGDHLGHADKRIRDRVYRVKPERQPGVS